MANRILLDQAPASVDALRQAAQQHYAALSPRLQPVAALLLRDPQAVATESSRDLARGLQLPPSTLTRFAKVMGYATFKQIQALCKQQYVNLPRDYLERIQRAEAPSPAAVQAPTPALALDLAHAVQQSLQTTALDISADKLRAAADLLRGAGEVWIHGVRRAYPVAVYLQYLLLKVGLRASLLDSGGGLLQPALGRMHAQGVLLVVTYSPHAAETEQVLERALQLQVPSIAFSDPVPSSHAKDMRLLFAIREGEVMGFRSLSSSMYVAQALALQIAQDALAAGTPGPGGAAKARRPPPKRVR
jgi:DNA-binding MurR/RpiR family transcriptional regulator